MKEIMGNALRKSNAEYTEIRIEDVTASEVIFRGEELDNISSSRTTGGIVRALYKGGWGYATFNDLNGMEISVKEACEFARLTGKGESQLAEVVPVVDKITAIMEKDFRQITLAEKKAAIEEYNRIVMNHHEKIETSNVGYQDSFRKVWYANSDGAYIEDERPFVTGYIMAAAREGHNVQVGLEASGGTAGFQLVEGLQVKAETVAKRAVELLFAPPVTGGKYTVILNPIRII